MIKGSIQEEYVTIINVYAGNIGPPEYIKQTLTDIEKERREQPNQKPKPSMIKST